MRQKESAGFAKNGTEKIEIKAIKGLKDQPQWLQNLSIYGYEFYQNGKIIGAVSTLNRGQVWIEKPINPEIELVVAALSSSILLRNSLEEDISSAHP